MEVGRETDRDTQKGRPTKSPQATKAKPYHHNTALNSYAPHGPAEAAVGGRPCGLTPARREGRLAGRTRLRPVTLLNAGSGVRLKLAVGLAGGAVRLRTAGAGGGWLDCRLNLVSPLSVIDKGDGGNRRNLDQDT